MNIEKLDAGFTNVIDIGRFAYFIFLKKDGAFMSIDELFNLCGTYNRVLFLGDDALLQKDEIGKLASKLVKNNSNVKIEIHSKPLAKPVEFSKFGGNTIFNIYLDIDGRKMNDEAIFWYNTTGANFVFKVADKDDIGAAAELVNSYGLKRSQAFLIPEVLNNNIMRLIKYYGYNIAPIIEWGDLENGEEKK